MRPFCRDALNASASKPFSFVEAHRNRRPDVVDASVLNIILNRYGGRTRCVPTGLLFLRRFCRYAEFCVFLHKIKTMPYNLPQRKSPRARWHDYTGADYFVTFCTKNREMYFGDIVDGQMVLSEIGKWAKSQIEQTSIIRQNNVDIPLYVVMPNHIHLIVVFNQVVCRDASNASADKESNNVSADARGASLRFGPQSGNLSSVVRGIKSAVTKYANEHDIPFAWQSRYHDHIIRNQMEMDRIADYIENNPLRWESDIFFNRSES